MQHEDGNFCHLLMTQDYNENGFSIRQVIHMQNTHEGKYKLAIIIHPIL